MRFDSTVPLVYSYFMHVLLPAFVGSGYFMLDAFGFISQSAGVDGL